MYNLSGISAPIGGNQYYTRVKSHGTPSSLEPSYIQSARVAGSHPFKVIDVNVDLSAGAEVGDVISLASTGIPYGCTITQVSLSSSGSIPSDTTTFQVGFAHADPSPADTNVPVLGNFTAAGTATAAGVQPGSPGVDVNGGFAEGGLSVPVTQPSGPSPDDRRQQFPVVVVGTDPLAAVNGATLNVKIVYFCP